MYPSPESLERAKVVAHTAVVDSVTAEVVAELHGAGIESIVLKGPSFARWLDPSGTARDYRDTDLLVCPADIDKAEQVLMRLGFRPRLEDRPEQDRPGHARAWARSARVRALVDLHYTLVGITRPPVEAWTLLYDHREPDRLGNIDVWFLDEPARALHAALHVAQGGRRVAHAVKDLAAALHVASPDTWLRASELARLLGADEAMAAGLRQLPGGMRLAASLDLPRVERIDTRLRSAGAPQGALGMAWFADLESMRQKLAWVAHKVFPTPRFAVAWARAVRGGDFSVPGAYVYRWAWLLRHAPRATLAVYRARRSPRRSGLGSDDRRVPELSDEPPSPASPQ